MIEELTPRELYGRKVSFAKRLSKRKSISGKGTIFGVNKIVKEVGGLQSGTEDVYCVRAENGEIYELEKRYIQFLK